MRLITTTLDWETAYGKHPVTGENVTLSKMTTEEYVRHPLFKAHGLGVKIDSDRAFYLYKPDDLLHFLKTHPWERTFAVCHHTHFDGAIFSWRAKVFPKFWGCTLSMGRALLPWESGSLSNLARIFGVGEKGIELESFAGKWALTDAEQAVMGRYCCNDVELTHALFTRMKKHFDPSELRLIDLTVRMFTEPVIQVDRSILVEEFKRERRNKRALLAACNTDKDTLASNDKFAELLLTLGVDPPKKLSPAKVKDGRVDGDNVGEPPEGLLPSFKATKGMTVEQRVVLKTTSKIYPWAYAFGKNDEEFKLLQDHPDPQVQAVVEARLGVKSTIKETRSKRFFKIGKRGAFPVYLTYYGAHTGRWSGGDRQNAQNMNRVNPKDPTSGALRRSWKSPKRHKILVRDLGQIEARVAAYTFGQNDLIALFRSGGDPYNRQASLIFGYEVDRKQDEFWLEGMAGKASVLGCGYGMGWSKFQASLRVGFMGMPPLLFSEESARKLGAHIDVFSNTRSYKKGVFSLADEALSMKPLNVSEEDHLWHCAAVKQIVDKYRESNDAIVRGWREAGQALDYIAMGEQVQVGQHGMVTTCHEGLVLPNGMKIRYHKLRKNDAGQYRYLANAKKKEWSYIYGGKVVENIVQALSRIILTDQMLMIHSWLQREQAQDKRGIYKIITSTHDEVVVCAPDYRVDETMAVMKRAMSTAPTWCADLPLKSSGGWADNYGDCEK